VQLGRPEPRSTRSSARPNDWGNRVDQRDQLSRVVGVSSREPDPEWDAAAVDDQMVLGAALAAVGRVGACLLAPLLARTLTLSRLARLQSMAASSPNQLSNLACSFAQTPACCQSRSRRQQVAPLPQPSSFGSSRQGQPVRRTKMIPPKAARSGTRGRPPLGLGGAVGSRGSTTSHRSSGTRDGFFMTVRHATPARF
jgi:hypothetical protein